MIVRNRAENNLILQIFRQVLEREFLFQIIIQIFEMTYGEHTYLKVLANLVSFPCTKFREKRQRFNHSRYLQYANWLEYKRQKILPIVSVVIYLNQIQVIKEVVIILFVRDSIIEKKIKKREINSMLMFEAIIVFITSRVISTFVPWTFRVW